VRAVRLPEHEPRNRDLPWASSELCDWQLWHGWCYTCNQCFGLSDQASRIGIVLALQLSKPAKHVKATQCLCWHGFAFAAGAPKRGSSLLQGGILQLRLSHRDLQLAKAWRLQLVSQIVCES